MWKRLQKSETQLSPVILQLLGVVLILVTVIVWLVNNDFNPALLGTGGSLLGVGEYASAAGQMREMRHYFERFEVEFPPPSNPNSGDTRGSGIS